MGNPRTRPLRGRGRKDRIIRWNRRDEQLGPPTDTVDPKVQRQKVKPEPVTLHDLSLVRYPSLSLYPLQMRVPSERVVQKVPDTGKFRHRHYYQQGEGWGMGIGWVEMEWSETIVQEKETKKSGSYDFRKTTSIMVPEV